ncbi:MAG TPA: nitroreductase family protein, partial [Methanothrix sp.]|nr:nitroreductase family protein [Methanothrix sp.]
RRELYINLGSALENLLLAAEHFGYICRVTYFPGEKDLVATISLSPGNVFVPEADGRLFGAIPNRSSNSNPYDLRHVPESALLALRNQSEGEGILLYTTADSGTKEKFGGLVTAADQFQFSNANYRSELGHWLGQGTMGPTGIQASIAQLEVTLLDPGPGMIKRDQELVNSTPAFGFMTSERNDRESQVRAGQAFERLWLEATALGLSVHPMSQVLEVPQTKASLAELLPVEHGYPQLAFCFGYATPEEHTPRRPLAEVIIEKGQGQ